MAHLTETQKIEILIFVGCGDKTRTQEEVCNLFNAKYPERAERPITRSTPPDKRLNVLENVLPRYILIKVLKILSTDDVKFREELYQREGSVKDILLPQKSVVEVLKSMSALKTGERAFDSLTPLTYKSTFDVAELQENKKDVFKHSSSTLIREQSTENTKAKIFMKFFQRKPTRAAVWRTLPPLSMEEMNLNQKAEAVTEKIAAEFVDWLKSLGGDEDLTLNVQTVVEMFEIGFHADTARALKIGMKEMPSIPQKVAEARHLPHMAKRAVLQREILKDALATKKKPHLSAFGRSLPVELKIRPPDESNVKKWLVCEKVPYNLESMATVWQGITHLKSTRAFCEFLMEKPEIKPPRYLEEIGMLDKKSLQERDKLNSVDYQISTSHFPVASNTGLEDSFGPANE